MTYTHSVVAHFPSHAEAERVVLELQKSGFDMQKLSIIGKDYQTTENVRGFLTWKDTAKAGAQVVVIGVASSAVYLAF